MEWISVREAADMTERSESTIRGWAAKAESLGLVVSKVGMKWCIDKESLKSLSGLSKRLNVKPIETINELSSVRCPECDGVNWLKGNSYKKLKTGDVSLSFRCTDSQCEKRWSLRVSSSSKVLKGLKRKLVRVKVKPNPIPFDMHDTQERVEADRRKFVRAYVIEGLKLEKVLAVFSPNLHDEIRGYYCQEEFHRKQMGLEGDEKEIIIA